MVEPEAYFQDTVDGLDVWALNRTIQSAGITAVEHIEWWFNGTQLRYFSLDQVQTGGGQDGSHNESATFDDYVADPSPLEFGPPAGVAGSL